MFCDEFHLVDLRVYDNCKTVVKGCDHVFNLAADMGGKQAATLSLYYTALACSAYPHCNRMRQRGQRLGHDYCCHLCDEGFGHFAGMGFIQSNHSVIMYNNTMISFNMMEVSRIEGIKR